MLKRWSIWQQSETAAKMENLLTDTGLTRLLLSEVDCNEITPIYYSLYSQKSPDFESENVEIRKAFNQVSKALQNRGIWVIDRGGDRDYLYEWLFCK